MSPDPCPNPTCVTSVALPARFLSSGKNAHRTSEGRTEFFWLMFSELFRPRSRAFTCLHRTSWQWDLWWAVVHFMAHQKAECQQAAGSCFFLYFISPQCQSGELVGTAGETAAGQWQCVRGREDWKPVVTRVEDAGSGCCDDREPRCTSWLCLCTGHRRDEARVIFTPANASQMPGEPFSWMWYSEEAGTPQRRG